MSYYVRETTKREILEKYASKGESFGNAFAQYLNELQAVVIATTIEGSNVTVVLHSQPQPTKGPPQK